MCETNQGVSASDTGENVYFHPLTGCICINSQQPSGRCKFDYRVKFKCCPECSEGLVGEWTEWLDRDNPSGTGDWEVLDIFVEQGKVCEHPISVMCEEVNGKSI